MTITNFLAKKPPLAKILEYIEEEAQRVAAERRKTGAQKQEG